MSDPKSENSQLEQKQGHRLVNCEISNELVIFVISDGRKLGVPLEWFPDLQTATEEQLNSGVIGGTGESVFWSEFDLTIRTRDLFYFSNDIDDLKEHTINVEDILKLELSQPTPHYLPESQHRYADDAIALLQRGEQGTSVLMAACFGPVIILLGIIQSFATNETTWSEITAFVSMVPLGFSGVFFSLWKFILSAKRSYVEGFKLGLLSTYTVKIYPNKWMLRLNKISLYLLIPLGYSLLILACGLRVFNI